MIVLVPVAHRESEDTEETVYREYVGTVFSQFVLVVRSREDTVRESMPTFPEGEWELA